MLEFELFLSRPWSVLEPRTVSWTRNWRCKWAAGWNHKPDALSRQFPSDHSPSTPVTILPEECVIGRLQWQVEELVKEAQRHHPDPGTGPSNRLFVPDPVRSQVPQLGHSSRSSCHPVADQSFSFLLCLFWWTRLKKEAREFEGACEVSAQEKATRSACTPANAQPITTVKQPLIISQLSWSGYPPETSHWQPIPAR